jgi:hypothetical protein
MELTAIVEQYLRMLTAGLATGSVESLAQHDSFAFTNNTHLHE